MSLKWTQANVFNTSAASGYDRTFLGYTTNSTDMGAGPPSGGNVAPSAGATGDTVTTASARGASELYSNTFAPVSGSVSGPSSAPVGTLQFTGTVTYVVNGVVATVINPRIVLAGDGTGQLFATGFGITGMTGAPYDDSAPMLNLDFDGQAPNAGAPISQPGLQAGYSAAQWQVNGDGSLSLEGIVPSVATTGLLYGTSYAVGSGPDRIPNRFGTLALQVAASTAAPSSPTGPAAGSAVDKAVVFKKAAVQQAFASRREGIQGQDPGWLRERRRPQGPIHDRRDQSSRAPTPSSRPRARSASGRSQSASST